MTVPKLNQDPSKYDSLGYCVFRGVLDATAVASVQQDLAKVLEAIPVKMMVYKDGKHVEADGRPEFLVEPHAKERGEPWLELCRHPRVCRRSDRDGDDGEEVSHDRECECDDRLL